MRIQPTALGYVNEDLSGPAAEWHRAQVTRLAGKLGYQLIWPANESALPLIDQAREADVDAVLIPSAQHLDCLTLDRLMHERDVEAASPRATYAHYFGGWRPCRA